METIDVFYRIFYDDLNPLTNQQDKTFYINHLKQSKSRNETIVELTRINKNIEGLTLSELKYHYYKDIVRQSYQDIKRVLYQKTFLVIDNTIDIKKVTQNYQNVILNYLSILKRDFLSGTKKSEIYQISDAKSTTDIFKLIYRTLDDLLVYLEQAFSTYLNISREVSYQQKLWFVFQYKEQVSILLLKITALNIPKILKTILCNPLEKIKENNIENLTYEYKDYLSMYIKVLWHVIHKNENLSMEELYSMLVSLEFNTFKAFFFYKDYINTQLCSCDSEDCKIDVLELYLKKINTITVTYSRKFNPGLPSLKEQLLIWIKEELSFYQKNMEASTIHNGIHKIPSKKLVKASVPEMSLITKLLYGSKFIDGPKKDTFKFLSNTFSTKNVTVISPESLSNHYYSVNESLKRSVQRLLKGMLVSLDDMKREL